MALYPIPFEILPADYSFGNLSLEIQIDHNTKTYSFVYPAFDYLPTVIRDTNDLSAYIGTYEGVGFRSTVSKFIDQWEPEIFLSETMSYDDYCQQDEVLRNPTQLTVLLDTYYDQRPVFEYEVDGDNNLNFLIANSNIESLNHGDEFSPIPSQFYNYTYYANHYEVKLFVSGTYQYPDPDYPVHLLNVSDGLLLDDDPVKADEASNLGYGISDGKAFVIF